MNTPESSPEPWRRSSTTTNTRQARSTVITNKLSVFLNECNGLTSTVVNLSPDIFCRAGLEFDCYAGNRVVRQEVFYELTKAHGSDAQEIFCK